MLKTWFVIIYIVQSSALDSQRFELACRGQFQQTPSEQRELRCRYTDNEVPYCRIAPFKLEVLNLEPYVAQYHEVIYEREILFVINETRPFLTRQKYRKNGTDYDSKIRTSRQGWIHFRRKILDPLYMRLMDMTGLSMDSGESLQVANYGLNEFFALHRDFSDDPRDFSYDGWGNRILTAIFYLNDVDAGGATVFPQMGLFLPPIRRSMIMWYNLHKTLDFDYRTEHGGCAVTNGTKWILTQWFHSAEQEFRRPCGLKADNLTKI